MSSADMGVGVEVLTHSRERISYPSMSLFLSINSRYRVTYTANLITKIISS